MNRPQRALRQAGGSASIKDQEIQTPARPEGKMGRASRGCKSEARFRSSGKIALLRALGMNVVPARAGAPVCARSLHIPGLRVDTSMRVEKDLDGERDDVDGAAGLDGSRSPR